MIKRTTAADKIDKLKKAVRVLQGGQGASKTFTVLLKIIDQCIVREETEVSIFQYELSKMKRTVIRDFIKIMKWTGNWKQSEWNKSSSKDPLTDDYLQFIVDNILQSI